MLAAAIGTTDKVKILLDAGAKLDPKNKDGRTAFDLATARVDDYGRASAKLLKDAENRGAATTP